MSTQKEREITRAALALPYDDRVELLRVLMSDPLLRERVKSQSATPKNGGATRSTQRRKA